MKNVVLSVSLSIISLIGFSQSDNKDVDNKIRFGFSLGGNYALLKSVDPLPEGNSIYNEPGLKLGLFMDYSLSENFFLSPKTELAFYGSGVETGDTNNSMTTYEVFPIAAEFMTHLVYKMVNGKNTPYILAGPNFKFPLNFESYSTSEFKNSPDFAIDLGIGLEYMFKKFILAPELRYSLGLLNINEYPTLKTLNFHNVSLVFNIK